MAKDILENVWNRYRQAGAILNLEDTLMDELTTFKMRLSFDLSAVVSGKLKRLNAIRVQHRTPLTDCVMKGGDRFRKGITLGSLESHAAEMSPKCWMHQLPFGGAKGGIDLDPNECTPEELEKITYTFVDELNERNAIGPFRDVPAPDMGTNPLIMFWMAERYKYLHRGEPYCRGVVTGKPVKLQNSYVGGIYGRLEATGFGLHIALSELLQQKVIKRPLKTIAIQGFGNVGMHTALFAEQFGLKVVAVADEFGGIYNPAGLDIAALIKYSKTFKPSTVNGFFSGEQISSAELFELECDVLAPAATEEVITKNNAGRVAAKVILEGANGPTTPEADEILEDRNILVIPDIYANSGGVVTSFFEWGMNTDQSDPRIPRQNDRALVLKSLEKMMRSAGGQIVERSQRHEVPLRLAAYILALEKAELIRARRIANYAAKIFG